MNEVGNVFHIQRFSIHDGPGIRTTVFLKGCPLRCFWCHNPEGRRPYQEIRYDAAKCIVCGACVEACPNHAHAITDGVHAFDRERCRTSGECVEACYSEALELNGHLMSVSEVLDEITRDRAFYMGSGGGVTLSGGEPMLFAPFAYALLAAFKAEGIHTAIETCGEISWRSLEPALPLIDLVMMDLKLISPEKHQEATGRTNENILANGRRLASTDKPVVFRVPVVPGVNDSGEEFTRIAGFVRTLIEIRRGAGLNHAAPISMELLPFHRLASDKYSSLGLQYAAAHLESPPRLRMQELANVAEAFGIHTRVR